MSCAHYGRAVPLALRRFAQLPCALHAQRGGQLVLPGGAPPGVHVVLLLSRRRHIEHVDSWLGVREAWERILAERGIRREGEMQMYICCLLPRFWPLRWMWRRRMDQWASLLREEHPAVHLLHTSTWSSAFYSSMQIHNDGRAYAMVVRNNGEILWASHDAFKEHLQEQAMVRAVREECSWRLDEQQRLLEGRVAVALPQPAAGPGPP
mmetsp:Transcript_95991/g.291583  ORF Transcript_95991/g.291583 Transcript_95991/m.291583 type:complete len:208 (+) Transcript_95991:152-775(+)